MDEAIDPFKKSKPLKEKVANQSKKIKPKNPKILQISKDPQRTDPQKTPSELNK